MKKTRISLMERRRIGLKQNQNSSQRKLTPTNPKVMTKNTSVNMVNTRSNKEQKAKEKVREEPTIPARETDLETPDQKIDGAERKTTEPTPMPNVEEQEKKTIEFSLIGNVDETTNNTLETIKDDFQTKRASFTEIFGAMVGMKPKKEEVRPAIKKSQTFGTDFAIATEAKKDKKQVTQKATVETQRKKQKSTPLPRIDITMASGGTRSAMKGGSSN